MGVCGAWLGLTLNHAGNHGALTRTGALNAVYGFANDLIGGSSLVWRYHHQVSHHIFTNSATLDMDVFSSFPMLRLDPSQPRRWYHRWQHVYTPLMFPLLAVSVHMQDVAALRSGTIHGVQLSGASRAEYALAWIGKLAHFAFVLGAPLFLHGACARVLLAFLCYASVGSFVLALLFIVSHNVVPTKQGTVSQPGDWAAAQIAHSANWGGRLGCFLTGGLNYQIEHHLFPAMASKHYPRAAVIVRDECRRAGIPYTHYPTLWQALLATLSCLRQLGVSDTL
jgi:fatty acid desaturase (delta-4 desaturase)